MENSVKEVRRLAQEFQACQKVLTAIGDETRQRLICMLLQGACGGSRVVDIARRTNLSRPAVSHHIQILKHAGIVKSRKEGTCVYYYLDPEAGQLNHLIRLFCHVREIMENAPDRSGDD